MSWARSRFDSDENPHYFISLGVAKSGDIPCWSLAALLNILENGGIHYNLMNRSGSVELHIYRYVFDDYKYSEWFEEPVNAILWLLEHKKL